MLTPAAFAFALNAPLRLIAPLIQSIAYLALLLRRIAAIRDALNAETRSDILPTSDGIFGTRYLTAATFFAFGMEGSP